MRALLLLLLLPAACAASSDVSRALGARCDRKEECDERCQPPSDPAFPGGFCTVSCLDRRDCPDEAVCADVESGICLYFCNTDEDCGFLGDGYGCRDRDGLPDGQVKVCIGG